MSARGPADVNGTVCTQHPAFQVLLKHGARCRRCADGVCCATGDVLIKTLREASGKDA
jgi:hypothetical protein